MEKSSNKKRIKRIRLVILKYIKKLKNIKIFIKMKEIRCLIKSFNKSFIALFKRYKNDDTYVSLAPIKDADKDGIYSEGIKWALENADINNIAITGIYGAGKSSVIKTFFSKLENSKYNPIYISLATFDKEVCKKNIEDENQYKLKNEFYHTLEKSILQQLLYQVDEKDVPLSRFKRISKHSKFKLLCISILVVITILIILLSSFPSLISFYTENYKTILDYGISKRFLDFLILLSNVCIIYVVYKIIYLLKSKIRISKFKIKDAEIQIDDKSESIFNKYLDEIIYFFQVTMNKVIVIEDLDRYEGDATIIFQKLRELNTLINSSNQVGYKVKFLYAIRDELFNDKEERTKFFDYIVPILPNSSNNNSNEIIWERLVKLKNKGKISFKFEKDYIDDIATFLDSRRLIENIINEFIIYTNKINNKHLDDKQLFAIVAYKNLYPNRYAELQVDAGDLVAFFKNKRNIIESLTRESREKITQLNLEKQKIVNENIRDISELKKILLSSIYQFDSYEGYTRVFEFDNENISIKKFLSNDIDLDKMQDSTIKFRTQNYSHIKLDEKEVFSSFGNKSLFIERWKVLEKGKNFSLKQVQDKISKLNANIRNIDKMSVKDIIKNYDIDAFLENLNLFEKFIISRGYLEEQYRNYITLFIPGNLTINDNYFISAVKNKEELPYNYKLEKINKIINKLDSVDYEHKAILNYDFLDYIVENDNSDLIIKIIQVLDGQEDMLKFIEGYKEHSKNFELFKKYLLDISKELWKAIYKSKLGDENNLYYWIISYLTIPNSLQYVDETFKDVLEESETLQNYILEDDIETIVESVEKLNIKFSNFKEIANSNFMERIYERNLYKLNTNMIKLMLKLKQQSIENFEFNNLSIIFNNEKIYKMKEYIIEDFTKYLNNCYLLNDSNMDTENNIIEVINNEKIDENDKITIIKNEECKITHMKTVKKEFYKYILECDKMLPNYENVLELYMYDERLLEQLIEHISKNIEIYRLMKIDKQRESYEEKVIEDFTLRYLYNTKVNIYEFKIIIPTFNLKLMKLDEITTEKVKFMINEDILDFNVDTYTTIKDNHSDLLIEFISKNIKKYIENIEEYDITDYEEELIISNDIKNDDKKMIMDSKIINPLNFSIQLSIELINKDIISIDNSELNAKIFKELVNIQDKINILKIFIRKGMEYDNVKNFLSLLDKPYNEIGTEKNIVNILLDECDIEFIKILKENNYIKSYKKGRRNNILIYNYRNN